MRAVLLSLLPALVALAVPAAAQDSAPPPAPARTLLQQVVPQPTGKNGYEELVMAGDALKSSRAYPLLQKWDTLTLTERRAFLSDRNVTRALALLRQGLNKPIFQPRSQLTFETLLPELAPMRELGKLLAIQQYVALADGRTTEALGIARTGMRLGRAVQMDTLIAGLVGIAIEAITIQPLADHLDQLTARDCQALYQICLEWLQQPNPQIGLLQAEQRWLRISLAQMARKVKEQGPESVAKDLGIDPRTVRENDMLIPKTPEGIDQLFQQAIKSYDRQIGRVMEELRKPPWQRQKIEPEQGSDPGSVLAGLVMPAYNHVDQAYIREAAKVQMLACHAAIRRYQWEHNKLPSGLEILDLGQLATDPFTGITFRYEVKGKRYSLTAAGSEAANPDDPRAVNGRVPVTLTPDD